MNYANQYQVSFTGVNKKVAPDNNEQFLIMRWDVMTKAFKILTTPIERFLYLYLMKFRGLEQVGQNLWLSPADFGETFGVSLPSYKTARKSMEEKGFLKKVKGNLLLFDPLPAECANFQTIAQSNFLSIEVQFFIEWIKNYSIDYKKLD